MKAEKNVCKCPDGSTPDSSDRCEQKDGSCDLNQFTCKNSLCVPKLWKCDGEDDCGGNKTTSTCNPYYCKYYCFNCRHYF